MTKSKELIDRLNITLASVETKLDSMCKKIDRIDKAIYGNGLSDGLIVKYAKISQSWKMLARIFYIVLPIILSVYGALVIKFFIKGG